MFVFKYSANLSEFRIILRNDCQKRRKRFQKINYRIIRFFLKTRFSIKGFGLKQKKLSDFGQRFQHSFKTPFHVTRGKLCGYRLSLINLQFVFQNRNLSENWLEGRTWTLSVQTFFWGILTPLKKKFAANSGLWA